MLITVFLLTMRLYGQPDSSRHIISFGYGINNQFTTGYPVKVMQNSSEHDVYTAAVYDILLNGDTKFTGPQPFFIRYVYALNTYLSFGLDGAINMLHGTNFTYDLIGNVKETDTTIFDYSSWVILFRIDYHLNPFHEFDPYIGYGIGYSYENIDFISFDGVPDPAEDLRDPVTVGQNFTIGVRYFTTDHFGIYAETGIAKSIVQGGLFLKF